LNSAGLVAAKLLVRFGWVRGSQAVGFGSVRDGQAPIRDSQAPGFGSVRGSQAVGKGASLLVAGAEAYLDSKMSPRIRGLF
jgi:hypothetical protein